MACNGRCFGYQCRECDEAVYRDEFDQVMHENYQDHYVDIAEREYDNEMCSECGFYLWDADSVPLNDCKTCERVKI